MNEARPACLVVDAGAGVAVRLAGALAQQGFRSVLLADRAQTKTADAQNTVTCRFDEQDAFDQAFDEAARLAGRLSLIVLSMVPASLMKSAPIDEMPAQSWTDSLHAALISTFYAMQAAHRSLSLGGTIVAIGPAMGLVGASRLTALSTLLEAQRALAKSAARQWGNAGQRVHWLSLGVSGNYPEFDSDCLPVVPELGPPPPALGRVPDIESGIAALIASLAADSAACITGSTLVADGGEWMVP